MAWPEEIPVVAVGGGGFAFCGVFSNGAGAVREVDEAVFEGDVPV